MGVSEDTLLCGTWYMHTNPQSGGIYRQVGSDTSWTFTGLQYHIVFDLEQFPGQPDAIYAASNQGLFASTDHGATWPLVSIVDTFHQWLTVLQISPFDPNLWAVGTADAMLEGQVLLSRNAGVEWYYLYAGGSVVNVRFSKRDSNTLYFSEQQYACRANIGDTSYVRILHWADSNVEAMQVHPTQPWVYILGLDSLARYDEVSGQIVFAQIPAGGGLGRSLELDESGCPLVGAYGGIFRVSEDLQDWQVLPSPIAGAGGLFRYASPTRWIVYTDGQLYCRTPVPSTVDGHGSSPAVESPFVYPNPARGMITFRVTSPSHIKIYNLLGQLVLEGVIGNSAQPVHWSIGQLSNGRYFYSIQPRSASQLRKTTGSFVILK